MNVSEQFNLKNVFAASVITGVTYGAYVGVPCTLIGSLVTRNLALSGVSCTILGSTVGIPVGVGKFAVGLTALGISGIIIKGTEKGVSLMKSGANGISNFVRSFF